MKIFGITILLILLFSSNTSFADEPSNWLKNEIDKILIAYQICFEDKWLTYLD